MSQSITIIITPNLESIATLNDMVRATEARETVNLVTDYLAAFAGGVRNGTITIVTNNATPTVSTDGGVSTSTTFNLT